MAKTTAIVSEIRERDLGFAKVDLDRMKRCGLPEVIFCPGKTGVQIAGIMTALLRANQRVLATRASAEQYKQVRATHPSAVYNELARTITMGRGAHPAGEGRIAVVCAGTSDIPVAEEAAVTAEYMGVRVSRVYDAGVAGLHRVIRHLPLLRKARALVVVAGMEGALPSVVGGLVGNPIIAVPTSVGYGISLNGIAALLAMLNSCVPGITVVNIDNGFGAGVAAAMIARKGAK